jgi:hypothetical protein
MAAAQLTASEIVATVLPGMTGQGSYVQIASLLSEPDAMFEWRRLHGRLAAFLVDREPTITRAEAQGRTYWRLRMFGFANITEASESCRRMQLVGLRCFSGSGL